MVKKSNTKSGKDWKKTFDNSYRTVYVNKRINRVIAVKEQTQLLNIPKNKGKWFIATAKMGGYSKILKKNLTKTRALKLARGYRKKYG